MCIEREKVDFKSREVNCLKECALALSCRFTLHYMYQFMCIQVVVLSVPGFE